MDKRKATFGAGCFWCIEAVFSELKGVETVEPGYMGGQTPNPTYEDVCAGITGHAEVAHIGYDPAVLSFEELLQVLFAVHDPTTLNRQGNDVGTQYRSAIFFHDAEQQEKANAIIEALNKSGAYASLIVTEVSQAQEFYPAGSCHQDYFKNNSDNPYCSLVIKPKLEKIRAVFNNHLK